MFLKAYNRLTRLDDFCLGCVHKFIHVRTCFKHFVILFILLLSVSLCIFCHLKSLILRYKQLDTSISKFPFKNTNFGFLTLLRINSFMNKFNLFKALMFLLSNNYQHFCLYNQPFRRKFINYFNDLVVCLIKFGLSFFS